MGQVFKHVDTKAKGCKQWTSATRITSPLGMVIYLASGL
jgi:hypothetical protein